MDISFRSPKDERGVVECNARSVACRLCLVRSCRVPLPSDPSRNGGHREIEAPVDHLGGGKAIFLVVPPAPERDGTNAELRPQLRAGNEVAPLEIRSLPRVFLPSQYRNFALSHVPPRIAQNVCDWTHVYSMRYCT